MNHDHDHPNENPDAKLLTIEDAAKLMTISTRHLRNLMQAKRVAYIKMGRSLRFSRSDLDAAINRMRVEMRM